MKIKVRKLKSENNGRVFVWGVYGPHSTKEACRLIDQRIKAIKEDLGSFLEVL